MAQIFDQDFRDNAVKMALERKISQKQLVEDLGVGKSTLAKWISSYQKGHKIASGESPEQKEIRRIKRELHVEHKVGRRWKDTSSQHRIYPKNE